MLNNFGTFRPVLPRGQGIFEKPTHCQVALTYGGLDISQLFSQTFCCGLEIPPKMCTFAFPPIKERGKYEHVKLKVRLGPCSRGFVCLQSILLPIYTPMEKCIRPKTTSPCWEPKSVHISPQRSTFKILMQHINFSHSTSLESKKQIHISNSTLRRDVLDFSQFSGRNPFGYQSSNICTDDL